ncbi:hypothetical protein [Pseudonocardia sp. GCM10023141]|uniref:hypothetical protein n=1 Tax=Pseudonocardia sp. GCM10023141 TaxID=3252653 RepID=UPI003623C5C9
MPYTTITQYPGSATGLLTAVATVLGDDPPDGLLARAVGSTDAGLHTVEVWQSQVQHDRFVAECLYPACQRLGHRFGDQQIHVAFEATDLFLADPTTRETS